MRERECIFDHIIIFFPIWFRAQKANLWHKWCIGSGCSSQGGRGPDSRLYTNNPLTVLLFSLLVFISLTSLGGNMKTLCCHLQYWLSKHRVRLLVLRARSSWQHQNQGAGCLSAIVWSTESLLSSAQAGQITHPATQIQTPEGRNSHTQTGF